VTRNINPVGEEMNLAPITVIGNVTADPELTYTQSEQARLSFSVAVNHIWYDQKNEKQEKVSYHNVTAWRYLAENTARVIEKGIGVVVYGRLEQRSYDDKDGNKRSITEIVAEDIGVLTRSIETITRRVGKNSGEGQPQQSGSRQSSQQTGARRARPATAAVGAPSDEPEPF
jgi:single-strand DNA-binding protein